MDWNRILNAAGAFVITYAATVATIFAAKGVAGIPSDGREWLVFCCVAFVGAYQKYSSSTRFIAPNRKPWTEDEQRAAAGLPPKRPIV